MKRNKLTKLAGAAAVVMMLSSLTVSAAEDSIYTTQKDDNLSKIAQNVYGDKARGRTSMMQTGMCSKIPTGYGQTSSLSFRAALSLQQPIPQDTPAMWLGASAEWQTTVALGGSSYVEQNRLQFYQETSYKSQGYRDDGKYQGRKEFFESNGRITGITIRDAEKEEYQVVTISVVSDGSYAKHSWGEEVFHAGIAIPFLDVCDIYTGKILDSAELYDDGQLWGTSTNDLEWGGVLYSIDCMKKKEWNYDQADQWSEWDADGNSYALMTVPSTYTITIPKGYDGLALLVIPVTESPRSGTEEYIMDGWKDRSCLMRVSDLYNILNGK